MSEKHYWFPVRPARNGWGWGLPVVWQGWAVLVAFFSLLIGGMIVVAPRGPLVTIIYACCMPALFLGVVWWKGEPQSMRDESSP